MSGARASFSRAASPSVRPSTDISVADPVRVGTLNLDGDEQSDLSVHGGVHKAVYVYPSEHYTYWREQLPDMALPWGAFGENLTTTGLEETAVHIGDRLTIGTAEFVITQPRLPWFKLGIRFGRLDMVKRFQQSGRSGFYLAVAREGVVAAGDTIRMTKGGTLPASPTSSAWTRSPPGSGAPAPRQPACGAAGELARALPIPDRGTAVLMTSHRAAVFSSRQRCPAPSSH